MKNYLFSLSILCSILSCSKSSDVAPATGTSYVSMKINGVEWKSSVGAGAVSADGFSATGALEVTGGKDILAMTLINSKNIGTAYKFEDTNDRLFQFTRQSPKMTYFIAKDSKGSSGVLTITKTKVAGTLTYANATFSGTAVGSDGSKIVITEGIVVNGQVN
ncbi:MAG: hypothetical protein U5N85_18515 [Arcicella sp.]|nr:hypothetical protein [Arcicella sp.]